MPKKRTYFRVRRIAAAELVRRSEAGHRVDGEAVEWAKDTLNAIESVGGRPLLVERGPIIAALAEHALAGATIDDLAVATKTNAKTCTSILYKLRQLGQIGYLKVGGRGLYFPNQCVADAARNDLLKERQQVYEARRQAAEAANGGRRRKAKTAALTQPPRHSQAAERAAASFEAPAQPAVAPALFIPNAPQARGKPVVVPQVVDHPQGVKRETRETPLELIDRFGVADPTQRLPGGFHEEWLRLRAGGSDA